MERLQQPDPWRLHRGSQLFRDDKKLAPLQLSHAVTASLHSAIDHLHGVVTLIFDANSLHTLSSATLTRGAIESAGVAIWLLESDDPKERMVRFLRWNATDARDRASALAEVQLDDPGNEANRSFIREVAESNGIEPGTAMNPFRSSMALKAATRYMGDDKPVSAFAMWQVASGFAHGRRWALLALAEKEQFDSARDPGSVNVRFTMSLERLLWMAWPAWEAITAAIELYERRGARPIPPSAKR